MVATIPQIGPQERRRDPRLPGQGQVEISRLDRFGGPGPALGAFELLDISAGGLALLAAQPVTVGTLLHVAPNWPSATAFAPQPFCVQVLSCLPMPDDASAGHRLRCKLVIGSMPAGLAAMC